jgi:hypothetical protein
LKAELIPDTTDSLSIDRTAPKKHKGTVLKGVFTFVVLLGTVIGAQGQIANSVPSGNLLLNSSFENGFTGWNGTYGIWSTQFNPGPISGSHAGVVAAGQNAMTQTFATQPGVSYDIRFYERIPELDVHGIPVEGDSTGGPAELRVRWNGQELQRLVFQNRTSWDIQTIRFTATTSSSQLEFLAPTFVTGTSLRSADTFVDDISVVAVPEPSTIALLVAGMVLVRVRRTMRPSPRQPSLPLS